MSELYVVDTNAMEWENGLTAVSKMAKEFRDNLGSTDNAVIEALFVKYNQKILRLDPATTRRADLVRVDAGYKDLSPSCHDSVEECFYLGGECYLDGEGQFYKGDYFWRPPGWVHSATTKDGFTGLLFFEGVSEGDASGPVTRRIRPKEEWGANHLQPDPDKAVGPRGRVIHLTSSFVPWQPGPVFARCEGEFGGFDLEHISFKVLSKNPFTGAQSLLVRLDKGYRQKGSGRHTATHQFYILEGSLAIGDRALDKGCYIYRDAGSIHPPLTSDQGALLFMKTDGWLDFQPA